MLIISVRCGDGAGGLGDVVSLKNCRTCGCRLKLIFLRMLLGVACFVNADFGVLSEGRATTTSGVISRSIAFSALAASPERNSGVLGAGEEGESTMSVSTVDITTGESSGISLRLQHIKT